MAQLANIVTEAQVKCSPAKVYNFFKYDMCKLVNIFPTHVLSAQTVEGEEGCVGNVKLFKYDLGIGGPMTVRVKFEAINDEERSITFAAIEGDLMQHYTSFNPKLTITDSSAKFCIDYEKANDSVPAPDHYVVFATQIIQAVDAYLLLAVN